MFALLEPLKNLSESPLLQWGKRQATQSARMHSSVIEYQKEYPCLCKWSVTSILCLSPGTLPEKNIKHWSKGFAIIVADLEPYMQCHTCCSGTVLPFRFLALSEVCQSSTLCLLMSTFCISRFDAYIMKMHQVLLNIEFWKCCQFLIFWKCS